MANDDELNGKGKNLKGRVKQAAGALTGNKKVEAEGAADRVAGAAQEAVGRAKKKLDEDDEDQDVE
jgi:uncharacterized protein YjbJ (UPF0337 family)